MPNPLISPKSVEAVARCMQSLYESAGEEAERSWDEIPENVREEWRGDALGVLEAALPSMLDSIRDAAGEIERLRCDACGEDYLLVWYAPNDLWNQINGGPTGKKCPLCFERACEEAGLLLVWRAHRPGEIEGLEARLEAVEAERESIRATLKLRCRVLARDRDEAEQRADRLEGALREIAEDRFFFCNKCGHLGPEGPEHGRCSYDERPKKRDFRELLQAALSTLEASDV